MTDEEKAVRKQFRLLYDDYWDEKSKNRKSLFDLLLGFTLQVHREARQEGYKQGWDDHKGALVKEFELARQKGREEEHKKYCYGDECGRCSQEMKPKE